MKKLIMDLLGRRFARLLVVEFAGRKKIGKYPRPIWNCKCDCGNYHIVSSAGLKNGYAKSCGCLKKESKRNTSHGMAHHPVYKCYHQIIRRCSDTKFWAYSHYGGRGIRVEWKCFEDFRDDMFPSWKEGLSLGRINNDGNYCKENCRWETHKQQMNNTRRNNIIEAFGHRKNITQWSEFLGITQGKIRYRIHEFKGQKAEALKSLWFECFE